MTSDINRIQQAGTTPGYPLPGKSKMNTISNPRDVFQSSTQGVSDKVTQADIKKMAETLLNKNIRQTKELWVFDRKLSIASGFCCSPVEGADDTLLVKCNNNRIIILDRQTGAEKKSLSEFKDYTTNPLSDTSEPGGSIFLGDRAGALHAIDPATGEDRWSFRTGEAIIGTPVLGPDNSLVCTSRDGKVYSLDRKTGEKKWEYATGSMITAPPVQGAKGTLFAISYDKTVRAMDAKTGIHKWSCPTDNCNWNTTLAVGPDETVFYGNNDDHKFYAIDGNTGERKWSIDLENKGGITDPVVNKDGIVFFGYRDGTLCAMDGKTGKENWRFQTGSTLYTPILNDEGNVLLASKGEILNIDAENGSVMDRMKVNFEGTARLSLQDGVLYAAHGMGKVYAIKHYSDDELTTLLTDETNEAAKQEDPGVKDASIKNLDGRFIVIGGVKLPIMGKADDYDRE